MVKRRGRDWPHSKEARQLKEQYRGKVPHEVYQQAKEEWLNGNKS